MGYKRFSFVAAIILGVSGCTLTLPVQGTSDVTNEVFTGTATGNLWGTGDLKITSNTGIRCLGDFKYAEGRDKGLGGFACDDGRQGDFTFTSSGTSGIGYALLDDGTRIQFLFGRVAYSAVNWNSVARTHETLSAQMENMVYYCDVYPNTPKCKATID